MKTNLCTLTRQAPPKARGQAMIEFTLVLPVILLLTVAVMDLARATYSWGVISNAARVGAHYAALDAKNYPEIEKRTLDSIQGLDKTMIVKPLPVYCEQNPDNTYMLSEDQPDQHLCDSWNFITVTVIYQFQPILLGFNPIKLSSQSTMVIE